MRKWGRTIHPLGYFRHLSTRVSAYQQVGKSDVLEDDFRPLERACGGRLFFSNAGAESSDLADAGRLAPFRSCAGSVLSGVSALCELFGSPGRIGAGVGILPVD